MLLRAACCFAKSPFLRPSARLPFTSSPPILRHLFRMASTLPKLPVFQAIASHDPHSTVVVHSLSGRVFSYGQLLHDVAHAKDQLRQDANGKPLDGERIAFLVENSYDYVGARCHLLCHPMTVAVALTSASDASFHPG